MTSTQLIKPRPAEDTLIDALRGCRDVQELKALEQRLASSTDLVTSKVLISARAAVWRRRWP